MASIREQGRAAWKDSCGRPNPPENLNGDEKQAWLYGWWSAFYDQQEKDLHLIATWINQNLTFVYDKNLALSLANIIVHSGNYRHDQPITGNVIAGHTFDIPAPKTIRI